MSNSSLEALLGTEHEQVKYLKQEQISLVLSKALSETYKHQPNDPVTFFSRYLLNHCNVQQQHATVSAPRLLCAAAPHAFGYRMW